jgi:hypothetical protein
VSDSTVNEAGAAPNCTALVKVRPEPLIVTAVPPACGPAFGANALIIGPPT